MHFVLWQYILYICNIQSHSSGRLAVYVPCPNHQLVHSSGGIFCCSLTIHAHMATHLMNFKRPCLLYFPIALISHMCTYFIRPCAYIILIKINNDFMLRNECQEVAANIVVQSKKQERIELRISTKQYIHRPIPEKKKRMLFDLI